MARAGLTYGCLSMPNAIARPAGLACQYRADYNESVVAVAHTIIHGSEARQGEALQGNTIGPPPDYFLPAGCYFCVLLLVYMRMLGELPGSPGSQRSSSNNNSPANGIMMTPVRPAAHTGEHSSDTFELHKSGCFHLCSRTHTHTATHSDGVTQASTTEPPLSDAEHTARPGPPADLPPGSRKRLSYAGLFPHCQGPACPSAARPTETEQITAWTIARGY
ncbi:Hypothetical protein SMAX5B_013097 [Scophthalmus maximus]|uniref:Uncharacterized protein n=1 Tax=Scophthalmus maximus TaxID=52904 RepID=A0A2U9BE40_SCOMX|nr:Hypothetical protein SMAX5B_013097 [Scophthalmus maximus]